MSLLKPRVSFDRYRAVVKERNHYRDLALSQADLIADMRQRMAERAVQAQHLILDYLSVTDSKDSA